MTRAPAEGGAIALLERDRELEQLGDLLAAASSGLARAIAIEGPAGIGKSRLLAALRREAADADVRVSAARGSELESAFSFGVVRQLYEPLLLDESTRGRALGGAAAACAAVVGAPAAAGTDEDAGFALLHALYWLTVNLTADGPLVITVDDVHWCDISSLRFLTYLARRLEGLPILLAVTVRTGDPGAESALVSELISDPIVETMRPAGLTQDGAEELVRERLNEQPTPEFAAEIHRVTGGNPLLLHELLKVLAEERVRPDASSLSSLNELGPRAASRAVLLRLARLPEEGITVARAAAVLGDASDPRSLASLAGLDAEATADAIGTLIRAEILFADRTAGFVHPLVRSAIYEDLPLGTRQRQHARASEVLAALDAPPERIAAHLLVTAPASNPATVEALRAAARSALARGSSDSATAYLQRALEEPPSSDVRPELLLELGTATALLDAHAAADHLRAARAALEDPVRRAVASEALVRMLTFTGSPDEVVAVAREAAAEAPADMHELRQAIEAMELVAIHWGADDTGYAEKLSRARHGRIGEGPGAKMLAAAAAWDLTLAGGSADECVALALEALAGDVLVRADPGYMTVVATVVLVLADRLEALDVWERVQAEAHERGSLHAGLSVRLWRGWTLWHHGDLSEAEQSLREAREMASLWERGGAGSTYVDGILAQVLVDRGDLDGAARALARAPASVAGSNGDLYCRRSGIELLLARGEPARALDALDEYRVLLRRFVNPAWAPWRTLRAQALAALDRTDEALVIAGEELGPARAWGARSTIGHTLRVIGALERSDGIGRLEEAVSLLEDSPARLELARALRSLGTALRLGRRPRDARAPLRRALDLAAACDAPGLAEEVRSELHASGARPRTNALRGVEALTPSESRVAALAAEGHSNRAIAQQLFVTPKTVEVHLSSAYRKLGIRSRHELARALGE